MKLKKHIKIKKINIIIIIVLFIILSIIYIFKQFNTRAVPELIEYSEMEANRIISNMINSDVKDEIANNIDQNNLFNTTLDNNGSISTIDFNSKAINKFLGLASKIIKLNLIDLENNNALSFKVPSGIIFDNRILINIFPKIPVKINFIGDLTCNIKTNVKSYGINNALFTINLEIEVAAKILLPMTSSITKIKTDMPIVIKLIKGDIPSYYMNGYLGTPTIKENLK